MKNGNKTQQYLSHLNDGEAGHVCLLYLCFDFVPMESRVVHIFCSYILIFSVSLHLQQLWAHAF